MSLWRYLLPYDKKQEQAQALSFPHYLELKCDQDLKPQPQPEVMESPAERASVRI